MTPVQHTNIDDFKISGNWEVFARHLQVKFSTNTEEIVATKPTEQIVTMTNSDETKQVIY